MRSNRLRLSASFAVHLEDLKVHLRGAANKEGLFRDDEPMLLIEGSRVGRGHNRKRPFMANLSALEGEGEQLTAQAGASGFGANEQKRDLTRNEPNEAKDSSPVLSDDDLTSLDGRVVDFMRSRFEPGVELRGCVGRRAEMQHRILVRLENRLRIFENGCSDGDGGWQGTSPSDVSMQGAVSRHSNGHALTA